MKKNQDKVGLFSIGFKLIAMTTMIIAASTGLVILLASWFFTRDIQRETQFNTLERADLMARKIEMDISAVIDKGGLLAAASSGGIVSGSTGEDLTDYLFSEASMISAVLVESPDNEPPVIRINPDTEALVVSEEQCLSLWTSLSAEREAARNGRRVLVNCSPLLESPALGVLFDPSRGESLGEAPVVMVLFPADPLLEAIGSRGIYTDFITDTEGRIIVHPDLQQTLSAAGASDFPLVADCLSEKVGQKQLRFVTSDGEGWLGSWKRLEAAGLVVYSMVPEKKALASVKVIQGRNIRITILVIVLMMIVVYIFSKSLSVPLKRLVDGAHRIRAGEFRLKIKGRGRDEIGVLTRAFVEMGKGLEERETIKDAFGKFVNKEIADLVLKGSIGLGGERKEAAIFFSDIRSFTAISERLEPEEVVDFLNEYMTLMVKCVNDNKGVVDKFIGDAIMAVWGAPISHGNDTENAVNAALVMRKVLLDFNRGRGSDRKPVIRIGCGINTGPVLAGQIGSLERMEYTVIGDAVNLASRVESLNKPFCTDILITEHAHDLVGHLYNTVPMKKISVKGKSATQQIFAVLGRKDDAYAPKTLSDLRALLGLEDPDLTAFDPDAQEKKYEVLE